MKSLYWLGLMLATGFLIWAHTHTDELPIVLGFVLIVSALVAAVFPDMVVYTGIITGASLFVAEMLVHFSVLSAPYPASTGLPWVALFGYVPAILGVGIGVGVRRMALV
jgi:uncharacterized membrane-anchored protein YitT (DUF2179 family)